MFRSLLERIALGLERRGIGYMVIGGQAVLLHGEIRLTEDIDLTWVSTSIAFPTFSTWRRKPGGHLSWLFRLNSSPKRWCCPPKSLRPAFGSISSFRGRTTSVRRFAAVSRHRSARRRCDLPPPRI